MAYNIKGKPWGYAGAVNVEKCTTAQEVVANAKLDWDVAKAPIYSKMPFDNSDETTLNAQLDYARENGYKILGADCFGELKETYATYRTDYNIPLGVVKGKYECVQNIKAFEFFDNAIGKDKAIWQTAGFFGNGERVFVSAKLPSNIKVGKDVVDNYLVFTNSHDGTSGVKILFTPIRVVCQNTLNAAIKTAKTFVSFRHTESVHSKIDRANEILGISQEIADSLNQVYNFLQTIKVTDEEVMEYISKNVLTESERITLKMTEHTPKELIYNYNNAKTDAEISTRKVNMMSDMYKYYHLGIGQQEIIGTAWGAANAISGYYSNVDNAKDSKRMDSILYGDKARKIQTALNMWLV